MIEIELKLFATIAKYLPPSPERFAVEEGTTVNDVVSNLNIPENEVKLIFINGRQQQGDYTLSNGDRLGIFPPVGGG